MPGPSRSDHCAEVPRASRRARRRAHLNRTTRRSDKQASHQVSHRARLEQPAKATRASHRARCQARLEPSAEAIHKRAVGQDAGPVSIRTIRRSATSEPSGNTPGPSRSDHCAEAPRASRRARRRARLDPTIRRSAASELSGRTPGSSQSNHPPKRRERIPNRTP